MADPTKYVPGFSYTGYESHSPARPKPGPQLDNDFASISASVGETIDALADIRRADGRLQNGIVTADSLSPGILAEEIQAAEAAAAAAAASADEAAENADRAEAATAVLEGFSTADPFSGTTVYGQTDYALDYDPLDASYVELTLGGVPQEPGEAFTLYRSGGITYLRLVGMPNADGIPFWGKLQRPIAADPAASGLTLEQFGVMGDDTGDQAAQIVSALTVAAGKPIRCAPGAVYRATSTIDFTGAHDLDMSGTTLHMAANVPAIILRAPVVGPVALAADYVKGSMALTVAALPSAPAPGDALVIWSPVLDPANRDNGASSSVYTVAEIVPLGIGSTTTAMVLQAPLRFTEGCDRSYTSAPRPMVDSYTVGNGCLVGIVKRVKAKFKPPTVVYDDGHEADWDANAVTVAGHVLADIAPGGVDRGYGNGLRLLGTYGARSEGWAARNLENNTSNGQYGYGVASNGTGGTIIGMLAEDVRHAYTTNATAISGTPTTVYEMLACCRAVGDRVIAGRAVGGTSAHWDTHHCATEVAFIDCVSDRPGGTGFGIRGQGVRVENPVVIKGGGTGVNVFTEWAGGDGAPYVNGRRAQDFTSCTITNPQIDCALAKIEADKARVWISGAGRYSGSPMLFYADGGIIRDNGLHQGILSDTGTDTWGILRTESTVSWTEGDELVPFIETSGRIDIDASASASTNLRGAQTIDTSYIRNLGTIRLALNAGGTMFTGGTDETLCLGAGRFEGSIATASGLPSGLTGRLLRFRDATSGALFDGLSPSAYVGSQERLAFGANSLQVRADGGSLQLFDTDDALSDGEDGTWLTFYTNDASNPAMLAGGIGPRGSGATGFVNLFFGRKSVAGPLIDAQAIYSSGSISWFKQDGVTPGLQWLASTEQLVAAGAGGLRMGSAAGPLILSGAGSPEGAVTAPTGSFFLRTNGAESATLYSKVTGTGNTGWVALIGVGAFGLGRTAGTVVADIDAALTSGQYITNGTTAGTLPVAGITLGHLEVLAYSSTEALQRWFRADTTGYGGWERRRTGGTWGAWRQINADSILGTVAQVSGIPTGSIIERGSNADGSYTKFADGTMICKRSVSVTPVANVTTTASFSWPATFIATPIVATGPSTTVPGSSLFGWACSSKSTTGFNITVLRNNTTVTNGDVVAHGDWF